VPDGSTKIFKNFKTYEKMKTDKEITEVKFLVTESKEILAYFPKEHYHYEGHKDYNEIFTSYAHVGQHSACSKYYIAQCQEARPKEYTDLLRELEGLGYNLKVLNSLKDFPAASLSYEQTEVLINEIYNSIMAQPDNGLGEMGDVKIEAERIVTEWGQKCNIETNF
jgi:hypothetical protein